MITVDLVIEKFIETRDAIAEIEKECEKKVNEMKELQQRRATWIQQQMAALGVDSFKTAHGTAFKDYKTSATVADWELFKEWVVAEGEYDFFEHRVSKTAVQQRLDDGKALPPGVNYNKVLDIKIRRK